MLMRWSNSALKHHRRERDRHELRMHRPRMRADRAADASTSANDDREQQQPAQVRVELRPEDAAIVDAEEREHERVEQRSPPMTRRDAALRRRALLHRVVQRAQLVVLLAPHDLVRADDLLAGAHSYCRVGTDCAQLLAPRARWPRDRARSSDGRTR